MEKKRIYRLRYTAYGPRNFDYVEYYESYEDALVYAINEDSPYVGNYALYVMDITINEKIYYKYHIIPVLPELDNIIVDYEDKLIARTNLKTAEEIKANLTQKFNHEDYWIRAERWEKQEND